MPATNLFPSLNWKERDALCMNGEFDRAVALFVQRGVVSGLNSVMDALKGSGQFEDELQPFNDPDYPQMIENDGTIIVVPAARPFTFKSDDLSTAELKNDGSCMIDLHGWAKDQGIDLSKWGFNIRSGRPVYSDTRNPAICPESDVFAGLVRCEAYSPTIEHDGDWTALDAIHSVLVPILRTMGKDELADKLQQDPWSVIGEASQDGRHKYVNYAFESEWQDFKTVAEAEKAACEEFDLDEIPREFYQYFQVTEDFAALLREEGMVVADVGELTVWGRESCGMAISGESYAMRMFAKDQPELADSLIRKILPDTAARLDAAIDAQRMLERIPESQALTYLGPDR